MITLETNNPYVNSLLDQNNVWPASENIFPKTSNYDYLREKPLQSFHKLSWREAVTEIVALGRMAPSSHNMQAWRFYANEVTSSLLLRPDSRFIGGPSDEVGRQAMVGLGTCAETVLLALRSYGIESQASIEFDSDNNNTLPGVKFEIINLRDGVLIEPRILDIIRKRVVYRGPFNRREKASETAWDQIVSASSYSGLNTAIITSRMIAAPLAGIQFAADNFVLQNSKFRKELGLYLSSNDSSEARVMPGNTFGLSDEDSKQLRSQLAAGGFLRGAFAAGLPQSDRDGILSASGIVVISGEKDDPEHWIKAGTIMQRTWLLAQVNGMGVGVMAGMVEVASKARELISKIGGKGVPLAVMRMGIPEYDSWPRSPRVEAQSIIEFI